MRLSAAQSHDAIYHQIKEITVDMRSRIFSSLDACGHYNWDNPYPYFSYPRVRRDSNRDALSNASRSRMTNIVAALASTGRISGGQTACYLSIIQLGVGECGECSNAALLGVFGNQSLHSAGEFIMFVFRNHDYSDNHAFVMFIPHDVLRRCVRIWNRSGDTITLDMIFNAIPADGVGRVIVIDPWRYFVGYLTDVTQNAMLAAAGVCGINILFGSHELFKRSTHE